MEDASGVDLDWFWRGWFYTTDHVDIAIENVEWFKIDTKDPKVEKAFKKEQEERTKFKGDEVNKAAIKQTYSEKDPTINDFYNKYDPFEVLLIDEVDYKKYLKKLDDEDLEILNSDYNYYNIQFKNIGGLVMPLIVNFTFKDGSTEEVRIPAEIWTRNNYNVSKVFFFKKEVAGVELDPWLETADTDLNNNNWPPKMQPSKFQLYKSKYYGWGADGKENPMQRARKNEELKKKQEEENKE